MAGLSQNLKAVITFGGNIDSFPGVVQRTVCKKPEGCRKAVRKLTKDRAKLAAEIKKAKLAGQSPGDLKRRYNDVSREIRKTESEQQKLNQQMQKAQRLASFKGQVKDCFAAVWVSPDNWAAWWHRDWRSAAAGLWPPHWAL